MTNAVEHAHARWIEVRLQCEGGHLTLKVRGNGESVGPLSPRGRAFGLRIMLKLKTRWERE